MTSHKAYHALILKEIDELRAQLAEFEPLQARLQELTAIEPTLAKLAGVSKSEASLPEASERDELEDEYPAERTRADFVEEILIDRGRPMKVRQIIVAMRAKGIATEVKDQSLYNSISSALNRTDRFKRVGKGLWTVGAERAATPSHLMRLGSEPPFANGKHGSSPNSIGR